MRRAYLNIETIESRIKRLIAARDERPLTQAEAVEIDNLESRRAMHYHRLDRQIEATRAKLQQLEAIRDRRAA